MADTPLHNTQRWLSGLILAPDELETPALACEIDERLAGPSRQRAIERLHAYTDGYPARIGEALRESYPALAHVIGARAFEDLVARYLPRVPSGIRNLNDVGSALVEFLAADCVVAEFPFAVDLARLEWAVHRAFHACEGPVLDPAALSGWGLEDWSRAVLEFQPSVAVIESRWPIREIWSARDTPIEEIDIDLQAGDRVLVHRDGFKIVCESIDDQEAFALETLRGGAPLGHTAQLLAERGGNSEAVARWFSSWSARGLIVGCSRAVD